MEHARGFAPRTGRPITAGWLTLICLLAATRPCIAEELATPPAPRLVDRWMQTWDDLFEDIAEQPQESWDTLHELRHNPNGPLHYKSRIPVDDPSEYPRIHRLDWDDPDSLFNTFRPNLIGQEVDTDWDYFNLVATDRPDFTDATYTVGRGVTVMESGYSFRRATDRAERLQETTRTLPELLFRYGVTNELELRLRWDGYVMADVNDRRQGMTGEVFGSSDLTIGAKYEILQQHHARPMLTAVGGLTVPSGASDVSALAVQPYLNLVAGWGLRRWIYLKMGVSAEWQRNGTLSLQASGAQPFAPVRLADRDSLFVSSTSVSLQFQVSKRVGGYTEYFGFTPLGGGDNRGSGYFNTGLCFYPTPNVQFDCLYGVRLSQRVNENFTGAGFSTRW